MSVNAEDEAKARLEVAQLYEEMGQTAKAVRYLLAAAEVYKEGGVKQRAREVFEKVLKLEPGNTQAQNELNVLLGLTPTAAPPAAAPPPPEAPAPAPAPVPAAPVRPPAPFSGGLAATQAARPPAFAPTASAGPLEIPKDLLVPTPWIGRDPRYVQAARQQLTAAPDRFKFGWDPLPKVDSGKVAARAEARKKAEEEVIRKANPRVESAFGKREGGFTGGTGFMKQANVSGVGGGRPTASQEGHPPAAAPGSRPGIGQGDIRGGNRDLADQIAKRMQERGKK